MSEAAIEALESEALESEGYEAYEAYEGEGEGEAVGEAFEGEAAGEAGYGEAYRDDARRRRQRQIMMARMAQQRRPPRRPQPPPPPRRAIRVPSPAVREVRSEVRSLDLDTKVALDSLRRRLDNANRLAYRNAWAAEASAAASQVLDSFEDGLEPHDWARALIRGAPTLLIAPGERKKRGLEGWLLDPRVAGGALLAAVFAFGHFRNASHGASSVRVSPQSATITAGETVNLFGVPVDGKGNPVTNVTLNWESQDPNIAKLDATTGASVGCIGVKAGNTLVTVTGGGVGGSIPVTIEAPLS